MRRLLALPDPPTAVIATNDALAVGALVACRKEGIAVPEQVSITGAGNSEIGASQSPPLTGIRGPVAEIGRAAAEFLIACLEGKTATPLQEFPFQVLWRGSTGKPPPRTGL